MSRNARSSGELPQQEPVADRNASRINLEAFTSGAAEVIGTDLLRTLQPVVSGRDRGGSSAVQALESAVEGARVRVLALGEALSDADVDAQRRALKAQQFALQMKIETSRKASDVKMVNLKAEVEHTFQKKFEEQVKELSSGEGTARLLQEALERVEDLEADLEESGDRMKRAEDMAAALQQQAAENSARAAEAAEAAADERARVTKQLSALPKEVRATVMATEGH